MAGAPPPFHALLSPARQIGLSNEGSFCGGHGGEGGEVPGGGFEGATLRIPTRASRNGLHPRDFLQVLAPNGPDSGRKASKT